MRELGQTAHAYSYDDLNRLVSGSATGGEFPNFTSAWTFNAIGNMTNKAGQLQGFAPSGANSLRPHAPITTSNAQQASFGYDPNGNVVASPTADRRRQTEASTPGLACCGLRSAVGGLPIYIGDAVEVQISGTIRQPRQGPTTTYYFFGGARIAMQKAGGLTYPSTSSGQACMEIGSARRRWQPMLPEMCCRRSATTCGARRA